MRSLAMKLAARVGRRRSDVGTALLLYPAGVLVLLLFGAMALDLSHVRNERTELSNLARSAADDAAAAIDVGRLRAGDPLVIDLALARRFVDADLTGAHLGAVRVHVDSIVAGTTPGTVVVELSASVPHIIATWMGDQPLRVRATGRRTVT